MGTLFEKIRGLVLERRYVVGEHAANRLDERGIMEWQVVDGIEHGTLLAEHARAVPNPAVEVQQLLADGTPVKAVWAHLIVVDVAKLVTVHFL